MRDFHALRLGASFLLAASMTGGCVHAPPSHADAFTAVARRAQDQVTVRPLADGIVIEVSNDFGIGQLDLTPPAHSVWPREIRLRLRYAPNRPYAVLEGLRVESGGEVVEVEAFAQVANAQWLEIDLPVARLQAGSTLHIEWVDFYR